MKLPRHQDIVDACKRIGQPRSLRAVRGWSRGEYECPLSLMVPLSDELGLDVDEFARELIRRREVWLERRAQSRG